MKKGNSFQRGPHWATGKGMVYWDFERQMEGSGNGDL